MEKIIKRICADATIEKKKHYNAASRKRTIHTIITSSVLGITLISGSSFLYHIARGATEALSIINAILGFVGAFLAFLLLQGNLLQAVEAHTRIANGFLSIAKRCQLTLALRTDDECTNRELRKKAEEYQQLYNQAIEQGGHWQTNKRDYRKATEGIKDGEEIYTPLDMSIDKATDDDGSK